MELADMRDLGSRGRPSGFKSPCPHHRRSKLRSRRFRRQPFGRRRKLCIASLLLLPKPDPLALGSGFVRGERQANLLFTPAPSSEQTALTTFSAPAFLPAPLFHSVAPLLKVPKGALQNARPPSLRGPGGAVAIRDPARRGRIPTQVCAPARKDGRGFALCSAPDYLCRPYPGLRTQIVNPRSEASRVSAAYPFVRRSTSSGV